MLSESKLTGGVGLVLHCSDLLRQYSNFWMSLIGNYFWAVLIKFSVNFITDAGRKWSCLLVHELQENELLLFFFLLIFKYKLLSLGVKQAWHEGDHFFPSSAAVKNAWSFTPIPHPDLHYMVFRDRDDLTSTIFIFQEHKTLFIHLFYGQRYFFKSW
jgi:hypothetical protein